MKDQRQQLLQTLLEKMGQAIRHQHSGHPCSLGTHQLSHPQLIILLFVHDQKNGATIKELATVMRVTPGAITQFINTLTEKKMVYRETNNQDRRIITVKLTTTVKKGFKELKKTYFQYINNAFSNFSILEIKQFIKLVAKIKDLPLN